MCSRPTFGFPVRGHRRRAEWRRKSLPAKPYQRTPASRYEVCSQFGPRGRDTSSVRLPKQPSLSHLGCETHQTWYASRHRGAAPHSVGRPLSAPGSSPHSQSSWQRGSLGDIWRGQARIAQQVQKNESGANRIGASRLQQISHILQVPVAFFFEGAPNASAPHGSHGSALSTSSYSTKV